MKKVLVEGMIYHGSAAEGQKDRRHRLAAHLSGGVPDARRGGVCAQRRPVLMAETDYRLGDETAEGATCLDNPAIPSLAGA